MGLSLVKKCSHNKDIIKLLFFIKFISFAIQTPISKIKYHDARKIT